mgnify:FL=1
MKRLLKILLAVVLAAVAALAFACGGSDNEKGTPGLHYMKFKGDDFYTVYGYVDDGKTSSLDIGKIADEKGVVIGRIKTGSFEGNSSLKEIIVPVTVKEIDAGAFHGMESLEKITLPFVGAGAKSDAFDGETAKSEDKITDAKRSFGYVFGTESYTAGAEVSQSYGSGDAVKYYLPNSLTEVTVSPAENYSVPMYAFYGCAQLYTVNLGEKVVAIGEKAFYNCANLVTVNFSANVKNIYNSAFEGCSSLKDYNAEKKIGLNFNGCAFEKIGEKAFYKTELKTVDLTVEEIGASAFAESKVESLKLTVKTIGAYAFYKCEKLSSVTITAKTGAKMYASSFGECKKAEADLSSVSGLFEIIK